MPKPNKHDVWCDRRLFVSPYYFALCLTAKQFERQLHNLRIPRKQRPDFQASSNANATTYFFSYKEKRAAIVCLGPTKTRSPIEVCGLLVHEAAHIWQRVCEDIGEHNPSPEFEAYSLQCIAQELMHKFSELGGAFDARTQR